MVRPGVTLVESADDGYGSDDSGSDGSTTWYKQLSAMPDHDTMPDVVNAQARLDRRRRTAEAYQAARRHVGRTFIHATPWDTKYAASSEPQTDTMSRTIKIQEHLAKSYLESHTDLDMPEGMTPAEWWKVHGHRFGVLRKLALRFMTIPASTGDVERAFSAAADWAALSSEKLNWYCQCVLSNALKDTRCLPREFEADTHTMADFLDDDEEE